MAPPAGCAPGVYQCFGIDVELQEVRLLPLPLLVLLMLTSP